ncbi:hypothetical protein F4808DRAFT_463545 [Astrocystis sublimbata]|nr:hypothetical protein F4808DRAFT_463545 [Astrocystis sublimbata]
MQPPSSFGQLSVVKPHEAGPFVVARSGAAGTIDHGLEPNRAKISDIEKNAPLLHPEFENYYNYEGRRYEELTEDEKRRLEMAVHYPHVRNGIMKAPFSFRKGPMAGPEVMQRELICRIFGNEDIFNKIFPHLLSRYEDLANFCGTSQLLARMVQSSMMHLNTTTMNFKLFDQLSLNEIRVAEAQKGEGMSDTESKGRKTRDHPFSSTVIISPVRAEKQGPVQEVKRNKAGYPLNSSVAAPEGPSFEHSMRAHYKLLSFAYLNGYAIKHLILHGMAWVNVPALRAVVSKMPKLEVLGVHACFLMHFGESQPLLRAMNKTNKERAEAKPPKPHVAVDFSPFYYRGPPYKADGSGHQGEYGLLPEEKPYMDTQRAVGAQLIGIWSLCQEGGQDFFTSGTGFRSFLDRLPMRNLYDMLRCVAALHDFYTGKHHSGVGTVRGSNPDLFYPDGRGKLPVISEKLKHEMELTVWQDLIIACNGESMLQEGLLKLLVVRGSVKLHHCSECQQDLTAYFYQGQALNKPERKWQCYGCKLEDSLGLDDNIWRMGCQRRCLAQSIFQTMRGKERSLNKVLSRVEKPAREETPDSFGTHARPFRAAITAEPGDADMDVLEEVQRLARDLSRGASLLESERETVDWVAVHHQESERFTGDELCVMKRYKAEAKEKWIPQLEFSLGISQRRVNDGRLHVTCLSWERLIREKRAELAIAQGDVVNNGPNIIWELRNEATSMLGASGGLQEYWRD